MQRIAQRTLQPAAIHAVIGLQVPYGRLHCGAAFEPSLLLLAQTLELATVNDLLIGVVRIYTAKAQIDHDVFDRDSNVLRQVGSLLQYGTQNVAVNGLPGKVRAPSIKPCSCETTMALLTPNS